MQRLLLLALALLLLAGCASGGGVTSDGPGLDRAQAEAVALKQTPLRSVDSADLTPPGPRMWVLYGRDARQVPMAVWVRQASGVAGYAYLDRAVRRGAAATAVAAQGLHLMVGAPVLVRPAEPAWYVGVQWPAGDGGQSYVLVDAATGELSGPPLSPTEART